MAGIRACVTNNFVEVFAEPGPYVSTAWSRFFLGQTWRLELRGTPGEGNGTGWINSNQFYGGALAQLRIGGPWVDVTSVAVNGSMTRVTTATQHNFVTGNLVEMYNGSPVAGRYGLVTVVNATQFNISGHTRVAAALHEPQRLLPQREHFRQPSH